LTISHIGGRGGRLRRGAGVVEGGAVEVGGQRLTGQVLAREVGGLRLHVRAEAAGALGLANLGQGPLAGAAPEELGHVAAQRAHAAVDPAVQGFLVAQHAVALAQALVLGQVRVLVDLGLPAVQPAESPGGGDLLGVVALEEVLGVGPAAEFGGEGVVGARVL
jgi:hypothetical protein